MPFGFVVVAAAVMIFAISPATPNTQILGPVNALIAPTTERP